MGKDKKYNAREVADYIDLLDAANRRYRDRQDSLLVSFAGYIGSNAYRGEDAEATKLFIAEGETKLLDETVDLHTEIRDLYEHAYNSFSDKVDNAANAKISVNTLDVVETDFQGYFRVADETGRAIENKVADLRGRYGKYGYITQPSYDSARNTFRDFCGGSGTGFVAECRTKFINFDLEECAYIEETGIEDRLYKNSDRIVSCSVGLSDRYEYNPITRRYIVSDGVEFDPDTGRFYTAEDEDNQKEIIKRLYSIMRPFAHNMPELPEEESKKKSVYRTIDEWLAYAGEETKHFLWDKIDGFFDWCDSKDKRANFDISILAITHFVGGIQSLVNYGDLSHTTQYARQNANSFSRGALKKLVSIGTDMLSIPLMLDEMTEGLVSYCNDAKHYCETHDKKEWLPALADYLNKSRKEGDEQIRLAVKAWQKNLQGMEVKDYFEALGSSTTDVVFLVAGGAEAKGKAGKGKAGKGIAGKVDDVIEDFGDDVAKNADDLPKGIGNGNDDIVEITLSREKYPESSKHIEDAIRDGQPDTLTIDRGNAKQRRKASLENVDPISGFDRDEYPPAMSKEGGSGASVRHIDPSDNRGSGPKLSHQLRGYPDGTRYKITIIDGDN